MLPGFFGLGLGFGLVTGGYTEDEAESLARMLTAGSHPVRLSISKDDTVEESP